MIKSEETEVRSWELGVKGRRLEDESRLVPPISKIDFFEKWYILIYINFERRIWPMESTAKVFQNGRSQAVRLPKAFRLKGNEVKIRKEGDKVILEPLVRPHWPEGFWDDFSVDPDFNIPKPLPSREFSLD